LDGFEEKDEVITGVVFTVTLIFLGAEGQLNPPEYAAVAITVYWPAIEIVVEFIVGFC
jgi:hypothetical protein